MSRQDIEGHIAIVGMAGRFPGAQDITEFWSNLVAGVDSVTELTDEELIANGVPADEIAHPSYVKSTPVVDDIEGFDARLFGFNRREAEVLDPQHRIFLESCHAALQHGGYDVSRFPGRVGVYGGCADNMYADQNVMRNPAAAGSLGSLVVGISNQTDYLATRVAYKFGLEGPAVNVVTACSTSLVALHLAAQALRSGDCDLALAGGVEVCLPYRTGYFWSEGSIFSKGGHIRPFDAAADGTIFGTGVGVLLVKRLTDALADNDTVYAVLRGSAVNNDGAARAGFTAPGAAGQTALITQALTSAGVDAETIGYVEAHGTGTLVGDPIEFSGLTQAYRAAGVTGVGTTPLGAVKGNIGHLGPAAGMAGLIKTILAMRHGQLPPTVNFDRPNPAIDFASSPFFINRELRDWARTGGPRRAGVSSFGIGGTNAHVVVEESPAQEPTPGGAPWQLLPVSAATPTALATALADLSEYVADHPDATLEDVAFTLQVGRQQLDRRAAVVAADLAGAATALAQEAGRVERGTGPTAARPRPVVLLFPGQGAQHAGMTAGLYATDPGFAADIDRCCDLLGAHLELDLRELLYPAADDTAEADRLLAETRITQPALFTVEYALARLWQRWGVEPTAMVGHSVGELVAACLAGVFSLEDALMLVAARGRLMHEQERGDMLAVDATEADLAGLLDGAVSLAAVNGPSSCVVAGPAAAVADFAAEVERRGIAVRSLRTSHAFHSAMMEPAVARFVELVRGTAPAVPDRPFVSTLTGTWILPEQATDPEFWGSQLRRPVRFWEAVQTVALDDTVVFVECGPGQVLTGLVRQHRTPDGEPPVMLPSLPHPKARNQHDRQALLAAAGRLWATGVAVDLDALAEAGPRRVALPAYPYERTRHWVDPVPVEGHWVATEEVLTGGTTAVEGVLSTPTWRTRALPHDGVATDLSAGGRWLALVPGGALGTALTAGLAGAGADVVTVLPGDAFEEVEPLRVYRVRPGARADYDALAEALAPGGGLPTAVVHAFTAAPPVADPLSADAVRLAEDHGFYSLLFLTQALAKYRAGEPARLTVLTGNAEDVSGADPVDPGRAMILGCCQLVNIELAAVTCRSVDVAGASVPATVTHLLRELAEEPSAGRVAYRGATRWAWGAADLELPEAAPAPSVLRDRGVYLITGGLGGIGLTVARRLAETVRARLVLTSRSEFPHHADWDTYLAEHPADDPTAVRIGQVRELEELGSEVLVCAADVTDEGRMRAVDLAARATFGPVQGVFHTAGVPGGGIMVVKTREAAEAVMRPKVQGTLVLDRVFGADLDLLVLFSSIVSVTGEFGLIDYCAANHFLDAFAHRRNASGTTTVSVNWCAWTGVGMAENADRLAPSMFRELQGGARFELSDHPLLDRRIIDDDGASIVYSTMFDPDSHWVVAEHRMDGQAVLPGTGYLELVRAAFCEATGAEQVQISDVGFLRLLAVPDPTEVRVVITGDPAAECDFLVKSRRPGAADQSWYEHVVGRVGPVTGPAPARRDLVAIEAACQEWSYVPQLESPMVSFGPHWRSMGTNHIGAGLQLLEQEHTGEYAAECAFYGLHPALLDNATAGGLCLPGVWESGRTLLPLSYHRLVYRAPIPPHCYSVIRHLQGDVDRDVMSFDIAVCAPDGTEVVTVESFTVRVFAKDSLDRSALDAPESAAPLKEDAGHAVDPQQGADILWRVLTHRPGPQVVVCPEGLDLKLRRLRGMAERLGSDSAPAARFTGSLSPRMSDTPYVEPASELARTIAGYWQDALGVDSVGADDDFFEQGGNSLVAVQLVARIRDRYLIELPIAAIFEYPTLAELADAVDALVLTKISAMGDEEAGELLARLGA